MAEEFLQIYTECMIEAVPKKEIKRINRRKKRHGGAIKYQNQNKS